MVIGSMYKKWGEFGGINNTKKILWEEWAGNKKKRPFFRETPIISLSPGPFLWYFFFSSFFFLSARNISFGTFLFL